MIFEDIQRPKKRLFLALILFSIASLALVTFLLWKLILPGLYDISSYLPMVIGGLMLFVILCAFLLFFCMISAIIGLPVFNFLQGTAWSLLIFLFPIANFIGKFFNINKEKIEQSFIKLSNHLFKQKGLIVKPERILLLLPHCLQLDTCPYRITRNVNNCKQCGQCSIGELLRISKEYGVHMAVVPGGTLARKVVKELRPKVVLAVACERDLTSGIQDIFPLSVFGILNERPCGPCFNTKVDTKRVEKAVRGLIGYE